MTGRCLRSLSACLLLTVAGWTGPAAGGKKDRPEIDQELLRKTVRTFEVVVRGDRAYIGRTSGFDILDIANLPDTRLLGSLELTSTVTGIDLIGDTAFLAAGNLGLLMVDLSDEENPVLKGRYDTPGLTRQVFVRNSVALLADGVQGLVAVDISRMDKPVRKTAVTSRNRVRGMAMDGNLLATAEGTAGVRLFDISRADRPRAIRSVHRTEGALDVALQGNLLLVAAGTKGVLVFRLEPGGGVERTAVIEGPGKAVSVSLAGGIAAICRGGHGIQVVDLAEPDAPVELAAMALPRSFPALRSTLRDQLLFVASDLAGLAVLDLGQAGGPQVILPRERSFRVTWPD